MIFSSITFLLYFLPVVFVVYNLLFFSRLLQNIWLFIASIFFYAWGEPIYVLIMLGSILFNWLFGVGIGAAQKRENDRMKKWIMILACIVNLGCLGVFKYTGFFVETINSAAQSELLPMPSIRLPIGISFFTFQALSYVIDVYRGNAKPQKNLFYIGLYIAFFPQLIAGPIVRYETIEDQIKNRKATWDLVSSGICRFVEGFLKKILIANNLAIVADNIFDLTVYGDTTVPISVTVAWISAIAYTFQLYYDFSAYSDMAIGLGRMFGFEFQENFRYPFVSKSIKEFMARWHISLAAWFNQYVYKSLGGSRSGNQDLMIRNMFIVWLLTGFWHGAAWTFIWWGLYFFVFIVGENLFRLDQVEGHDGLRHVYCLFVVIIAMVIFRSESGSQLSLYLTYMFGMGGNAFYSPDAVMFLREYGLVFLAAIIFALPIGDTLKMRLEEIRGGSLLLNGGKVLYVVALPLLLFFCVAILAKGGYNPFIYFNF